MLVLRGHCGLRVSFRPGKTRQFLEDQVGLHRGQLFELFLITRGSRRLGLL